MSYEPIDEFECIHIAITDELLTKAEVAAYMFDQEIKNRKGEIKPFNPKEIPDMAVYVKIPVDEKLEIEIFFDPNKCIWRSRFVLDGKFGMLSMDQMFQFFETDFYKNLIEKIDNTWPSEEEQYSKYLNAIHQKKCIDFSLNDDDREIYEECMHSLNERNMPNKRVDLANQDVTGDGKRDYSGSGRKIQSFGDMGVNSSSGLYFCWPREGKEFKWNSWKDWTKLKPFAKMSFKYNGRSYGISLSLFDEQFENRGFRGYDIDWEPPLAWLTPGECDELMQLSIVRKFLRICYKRVHSFIDLDPETIYKYIDKPERVEISEIEQTQRVIKHAIGVAFKKHQADNYCYD